MTLNVIGHKIPDTDSVVSAILLSSYYNKLGINACAKMLGEMNNETRFLLEVAQEASPEIINTLPAGSNVVLVDHNENSQTIDNISELNLVGIVDHHKFGGLATSNPIFVRAQPLCSTASIIYKMMIESNLDITKSEAILLIGAIISDSLYFRSPTSTQEDKLILEKLNEIAKIQDLQEFSLQLFQAKSDLGDISAKDLVKIDYKEFEVNGKKAGVGVVETTNPDYSLNRKNEILQAMKTIKEESNINYILLSIVDILNEKNTTIVLGESEEKLIKEVFSANTVDNLADLGKILSRKKQIIPQLTEYLNK